MSNLENVFIEEAKVRLAEVKLIFIKSVWLSVENDKRKIIDLLEQTFPKEDWISKKIDGQRAWEYVNNINIAFYCKKGTSGASKYREGVIQSQKGEFCTLCGETKKENLQVDHITRVHEGGRDKINNLQLLCLFCHSGKTNLENESMGYLLKVKINDETLDKSLRYYLLYNRALEIDGRRYGQCPCGGKVPNCILTTYLMRKNTVPSIHNVKIRCNQCN
jgi:hypothetical protein